MKRLIMAAVVLVAWAGCAELQEPAAERAPSFSQQQEESRLTSSGNLTGAGTANMAAQKWFDITIDAGATLKPNAPINLTVVYRARFATPEADLRIMLPEVETAKLTAWDQNYKVQPGVVIPARLESSSGFAAGGEVTQSVDLVIPAPGIYRVVASAESKKVRPDEITGLAQPVVHEAAWLLVDETGGRVLQRFDRNSVPSRFRPQPGPFREPLALQERVGRKKPGTEYLCGPPLVCLRVSYFDPDLDTYVGTPGVAYKYTSDTVFALPDEHIPPDTIDDPLPPPPVTGYAGEDGVFYVPCPTTGPFFEQYFSGSASFDNSRARIIPNTTAGGFKIWPGDCGHWLVIDVPADEGRTWTNAMHTIKNSRALMNARGKLDIEVNGPGNSTCGWVNFYQRILVVNVDLLDCIWGGFGVFAFPHEYGHAVHDTLGGGQARPVTDCSQHYPGWPAESFTCAYNEGWAHYHGLVTVPTSVFPPDIITPHELAIESNYENNRFYALGLDGSLDEGPVMSFFYDLFDGGSGESHDLIDLDIQDVLTVMNDCKVLVSGVWIQPPAGIDHLIWCLENGVDTDITGGDDYFTARSVHPTAENQSDHYWDETHVRKLWLKNLYNVDG